MELNSICPKCKGQMEEGFSFARNLPRGELALAGWSNGQPETSFWQGLKLKEDRKITTYRCTGCGYLESYA